MKVASIEWNNTEMGVHWPELKDECQDNASIERGTLEDGTTLKLSAKN